MGELPLAAAFTPATWCGVKLADFDHLQWHRLLWYINDTMRLLWKNTQPYGILALQDPSCAGS